MSEVTLNVQEALKTLFLYHGRLDGLYGRHTAAAIKAFNKIHKYTFAKKGEDARITQSLLFHLGITPIKDRMESEKIPYDTNADLEKFYGKPGTNLVRMSFPYKMRLAWNTKVQVSATRCNAKAKDDLIKIFSETLNHYSLKGVRELGLDLYGGCYNKRKIRGGNRWSTHAYAVAVDLNPVQNRLHWRKDKALFAQPQYDKFWDIVYANNFYGLGIEKNYDFMHIQRAIPIKH